MTSSIRSSASISRASRHAGVAVFVRALSVVMSQAVPTMQYVAVMPARSPG